MKAIFVLLCFLVAAPAAALDVNAVEAPSADVAPRCKCASIQNPQEMGVMPAASAVLLLVGGFCVWVRRR